MTRRNTPATAHSALISTRAHAVFDYALPLSIAVMATNRRFGRPVRAIMSIGPVWHLGYTLITRYKSDDAARPALSGTALPQIGIKTHFACDAVGALSFIAAGLLMRRQKTSHRLLLAALGLGELAVIALSEYPPKAGAVTSAPVKLRRSVANASQHSPGAPQ